MPSGGTEQSGYVVKVDAQQRVLHLRVWGMWDKDVTESFREAMSRSFSSLRGKPWYVLADITAFPPQSESVAAVHGALMARAAAFGMKRAANVVSSSLTQLQIKRLAESNHSTEMAFFKDPVSALSWLLSA